jgi:hypothetical protein
VKPLEEVMFPFAIEDVGHDFFKYLCCNDCRVPGWMILLPSHHHISHDADISAVNMLDPSMNKIDPGKKIQKVLTN